MLAWTASPTYLLIQAICRDMRLFCPFWSPGVHSACCKNPSPSSPETSISAFLAGLLPVQSRSQLLLLLLLLQAIDSPWQQFQQHKNIMSMPVDTSFPATGNFSCSLTLDFITVLVLLTICVASRFPQNFVRFLFASPSHSLSSWTLDFPYGNLQLLQLNTDDHSVVSPSRFRHAIGCARIRSSSSIATSSISWTYVIHEWSEQIYVLQEKNHKSWIQTWFNKKILDRIQPKKETLISSYKQVQF